MSATSQDLLRELDKPPFWRLLSVFDWLWALLVVAGSAYTFVHYQGLMDDYEVGILFGVSLALIGLGWSWKPVRALSIAVALLSLAGINLYGGSLAAGESNFFLRFFLASQSAVMWMSALFIAATPVYFAALAARSEFTGKVASAMTWSAVTMGLVGLMVRWRESYLLGGDIGHIPVSNLYEVFILFSLITALIYLYYEMRYRSRAVGGFVLLVISAAVGFLLWYSFDRGAHEIQPLVPALQSYWMKIHVPANFIGYGAFSLAAMVGVDTVARLGRTAQPGWLPGLTSAVHGDDGRCHVQIHRAGFCLLYGGNHSRRAVGCRGLGWLLVLGSQGNLGADRVAELRRLVSHAPDQGLARRADGLVGGDRPVCHRFRLPRR